jgi:alternate signal-mediated exported protein
MRTRTKAWIAGAAGAAVLLGTGGTLALWQDESRLTGNTITTGRLAVSADAMSWTDESTSPGTPIGTIDDFRLVPGDVVEGRAVVRTTVEGDNLEAALSLAGDQELVERAGRLDVDVDVVDVAGTLAGEQEAATVVVRITFPLTPDAPHLDDTASTVDLGDLEVVLTQVR